MRSKQRISAFWVGIVLVILLAGTLRLLSYDFSLPYLDYPDEPNFYLKALEWRGKFTLEQDAFILPVPGYIAMQAALQPVLEPLGVNDLASTTRVMRFISVIANLATVVVIALTARLAGGALAGLIAACAWAFAPLVLEADRRYKRPLSHNARLSDIAPTGLGPAQRPQGTQRTKRLSMKIWPRRRHAALVAPRPARSPANETHNDRPTSGR